MNLHLCHTETAAYTCDISSNAPAFNIINGHDGTLLHPELRGCDVF